MRPEDVREHLIKHPFQPFRIYMSDGATFDVGHPEMCIIERSSVYVVIRNRRQPWLTDRLAHCALIHITRIEPVNGRNGQGRRGKGSRGR